MNLNALYAFYGVFDTGNLGQSQRHWFVIGKSLDGLSDFDWTVAFEVHRPNGAGSGGAHLFNHQGFIQDPTNPSRWIGLIAWTFNNGGGNLSGVTPFYIDTASLRFGALFEQAGWCDFPLGQKWDGFSDSDTCRTDTIVGDNFYRIPGFQNKNMDHLSLVGGKALILQMWQTTQRCGSDPVCAEAHAPCPPGQDTNLYVQRRSDPEWNWGRYWTVRELDFSTWDTSSAGHQWNGPAKTILDGAQAAQFRINPTDFGTVGSYHGGSLHQFVSGGPIYLYLPVRHILCLPDSGDPLNAWDRYPKSVGGAMAGASTIWFRLTTQ